MRSGRQADATRLCRTRGVIGGLFAVITVVFVVWAWASDVQVFGGVGGRLIDDVVVGVAFPFAALAGKGDFIQRLLVAAVGVAWLAGSVWGAAIGLHQSVLIVMVAAYPSGRLRPWPTWLTLPAAVFVAVLLPGPLVVALVIGAEAVGLAILAATDPWTPRIYSVAAASALSLTLLHAAWLSASSRSAEPGLYEAVLIGIALAYALTTQLTSAPSLRLSEQIVGGNDGDDLGVLERLLADMLHDPHLHLTAGPGSGRPVRNGEQIVASVDTISPLLADPRVAAAVDESVRLLVEHRRLQSSDREGIAELDAARRRLVATGDAERRAATTELARHVGGPVAAASRELENLRIDEPDARKLLATSARLLRDVSVEIDVIVSGVPRETLGDGRLVGAVHDLAMLSSIPVRVGTEDHPVGSAITETALFYICREALVNAAKHSSARQIDIRLSGRGNLTLEVVDDGIGGADPDGLGLRGLADRASVVGATLSIDSIRGAGTTIRVVAPAAANHARSDAFTV